jgi:PIN domain nuclease of toxin-antitoxin system
MIYLLDTHTLIWAICDTEKLSDTVRQVLTNRHHQVYVSVVSFWEIALKASIGKFSFDNLHIGDVPEHARQMGLSIMDMKEPETITFAGLPVKKNHKDPFDRMIIWQAITKKMILISKDGCFEQYKEDGLQRIW